MTGAVAAACMGVTTPATVGSPSTPSWHDMFGQDTAATNTIALTGFTGPISITASRSGGGILTYSLNGGSSLYTGAFTVHPGDTLGWSMSVSPFSTVEVAGVLTVTDATHSTTLATINYDVWSSRGPRP